ncbi:ATP-binding cassette transporter subfamily G [Operophtera brumata]|uniref:ATP-binding cassette transporter subfamily G n=1 Tax=Operophtera brumata TaxID=104452 RepID=A0A0L7KNS4_OPEBR|nr:ATP-binding cassette transporter subfamily G [Operophtera brumata]
MTADKEVSYAGNVDTKPIISDRKGSLKVTMMPPQHKTLTHLPKRPPVDLAFTDLTYKVQEGRKSRIQPKFELFKMC